MPRCPKCKGACDPVVYEGVRIYNCGPCGGHWLDEMKLDRILATRGVDMPEPVRQKMIEIADAADSKHTLWCMSCGVPMAKDAFKHWPEIQIDYCRRCQGIWLDQGELEKCQIFWEAMQDNPDFWQDGDLNERKALLDAELSARRAQNKAAREEAESRIGRYRRFGTGHPHGTGGPLADMLTDLFGRD